MGPSFINKEVIHIKLIFLHFVHAYIFLSILEAVHQRDFFFPEVFTEEVADDLPVIQKVIC